MILWVDRILAIVFEEPTTINSECPPAMTWLCDCRVRKCTMHVPESGLTKLAARQSDLVPELALHPNTIRMDA
jgi:hypothetical protein